MMNNTDVATGKKKQTIPNDVNQLPFRLTGSNEKYPGSILGLPSGHRLREFHLIKTLQPSYLLVIFLLVHLPIVSTIV